MDNHPIAECYPSLAPGDYEQLKAHISANGLQNAIVLYEGKILDGTHRARACRELAIEPVYATPEIKDPFEYVIGQNERRRQLTQLDRIEIAEKMAALKDGSNQYKKVGPSKHEPKTAALIDRPKAARLNGVSVTALDRFRRVKTHALPEVLAAVKSRKISLSAAGEDIAALPKEQQLAALETASQGKRKKRGSHWAQPAPIEKTELSHLEAIEAKALERINRPSLYPTDLALPIVPESTHKTEHIQEAILELRPLESQIATMGRHQLYDAVQLCVQRIQTYGSKFTRTGLGDYRIELPWQKWAEDVGQKVQARLNMLLARKPEAQNSSQRRPQRSGSEQRLYDYGKKLKRLLREIDFLAQEAEQVYDQTTQVVRNYFEERVARFGNRSPQPKNGAEPIWLNAPSH